MQLNTSEENRNTEFEEVIEKNKRLVYGTALTQLKSRHDADDVFQEVFLTYLKKQPCFENDKAAAAWFLRTTIFKCKQLSTSIWNTRVEKSDSVTIAESMDIKSPLERLVYAEVLALDDNYRLPVYLHYFLGMEIDEISNQLGLRKNTVSVRLNRARKLLKKRLEEIL